MNSIWKELTNILTGFVVHQFSLITNYSGLIISSFLRFFFRINSTSTSCDSKKMVNLLLIIPTVIDHPWVSHLNLINAVSSENLQEASKTKMMICKSHSKFHKLKKNKKNKIVREGMKLFSRRLKRRNGIVKTHKNCHICIEEK